MTTPRRGLRGLYSNQIGSEFGIEGVERFLAYICIGWRLPKDVTPTMFATMFPMISAKLKEDIPAYPLTFISADDLLKRLNKPLWNVCFIRYHLQDVELPSVIGKSELKDLFEECFATPTHLGLKAISEAYIYAAKHNQLPCVSFQKAKQTVRFAAKKKSGHPKNLYMENIAADLLSFTFSY